MKSFDYSKKFTVENFAKYVAPSIRKTFNAIEVHDTELLSDDVSKHLDRENCIDGYFVTTDGTKEYFSSRIQKGFYRSFTIRKSRDTGNIAEYQKLCKLISNGNIYPKWFIQTYIRQDNSVITTFVQTKDLINFIKSTKPPVKHTNSRQHGQADFYVCYWTALKKFGVNVIFENKKSA